MKRKAFKFYAVFSYDNDGISIHFPDLSGCLSCGFSTEEAICMAKEALELYLDGMKEEDIPMPQEPEKIEIRDSNQKIIPIEVSIVV